MHMIKMWTLPLLLLLTTLLSHMPSLACVDVPPRFRHINKRSTDEHTIISEDNTIPMEFYNELENITTISEYIERFVDKDTNHAILDPEKRSVQRDNAVNAVSARCLTENVTVRLIPYEESNDPQVVYFPSCTRVKRCSGCCSPVGVKICEPSEKEIINFKITKQRYGVAKTEYVIVPIEQHIKCACVCKIKERDCKPNQYYSPTNCRCECANYTEKEKCLQVPEKYWDSANCICRCRGSQTCTTGTYFNENQCKCIDPMETSFSSLSTIEDRRRFIVKAVPVEIEPDNSTLYST